MKEKRLRVTLWVVLAIAVVLLAGVILQTAQLRYYKKQISISVDQETPWVNMEEVLTQYKDNTAFLAANTTLDPSSIQWITEECLRGCVTGKISAAPIVRVERYTVQRTPASVGEATTTVYNKVVLQDGTTLFFSVDHDEIWCGDVLQETGELLFAYVYDE